MARPGQLGRISKVTAMAVLKKNSASARLSSTAITPGWKLQKPTSYGVAPPTQWLKSK